MASSSSHQLLFFCLFCIILSITTAQPSSHPRALVLPVSKDPSTLQYVTRINQRTPLVPISLVVDVGGQFLWVNCDRDYVSSSYLPARCRSAQCSLAGSIAFTGCYPSYGPARPGWSNDTCSFLYDNPITRTYASGELAQDVVSLQSTNGRNPGQVVSVPRFLFTCGNTFLLEGLASGTVGMAGLGRARIGMPSLLAAAFSFNRKFAICLSSNGVIFFGNEPYFMLPNIDISSLLIYTPLLVDSTTEYFIGVRSIKVNEKTIPLNSSLRTKISTVNPYTVLETSIYNNLIQAFITESNLTRVASVAPFEYCFDSTGVPSTRVGPAVPSIDLVLQSESVYWRIFGANSMVQVRNDVLCLGIVNGGLNPWISIVIGGYQLEDNLVQFDLATSRVGFSSSLLFRQTTCSNFNFTSSV